MYLVVVDLTRVISVIFHDTKGSPLLPCGLKIHPSIHDLLSVPFLISPHNFTMVMFEGAKSL